MLSQDIDIEPARAILEKHGVATAVSGSNLSEILIPCLQEIQAEYGYLPRPVLEWVSKQTAIPVSRMYGVITFYAQFFLEPHGRHTVRCCRGTACHVKGGESIADAIRKQLGVEEGETTDDMRYTFETVACLGTCFLAPVMMVDNDYFGRVTPGRVSAILRLYQ